MVSARTGICWNYDLSLALFLAASQEIGVCKRKVEKTEKESERERQTDGRTDGQTDRDNLSTFPIHGSLPTRRSNFYLMPFPATEVIQISKNGAVNLHLGSFGPSVFVCMGLL